jgi:hypothetical protein
MEPVLVAEGRGPEVHGLSQIERVVDTYIAPSKTFNDIRRSTSWWLPFLLFFIVSTLFAYSVDKKVGFDAVAQQQIQQSQKAQDRLASLAPADRANAIQAQANITKYSTYVSGVFFLLFPLIFGLLHWATINFGFGAKTTFGQNFAVEVYAALPLLLQKLLTIILILAGVGTENFNLSNPIGTNLGYYLTDSPVWLKTMGTFFDLFTLWALVLSIVGVAAISGKSRGQAAIVVVSWWAFMVLIFTGLLAAFA